MIRWERCTRRSRQASRLRTTRRLPFLFITQATATAERLKRNGHIEPLSKLIPSQFGIMSQATLSKYSSWHTGHLHSSCNFKVSNSLLFFASHSQNIFRECSSPGPHFIRWKIYRTFFGEKDTNRFDNRLSLSAFSQLVLESAFWLRWNPNWLSSLVYFLS